jgi:hypothetical protein
MLFKELEQVALNTPYVFGYEQVEQVTDLKKGFLGYLTAVTKDEIWVSNTSFVDLENKEVEPCEEQGVIVLFNLKELGSVFPLPEEYEIYFDLAMV